ncbi:MAG: AAA family ATPase [Dysgonamonadaceae bacterium]|jgi:putative ATP-dependent endonuclease of OLD family|nr:AAA family ATPase [Dysgonamonadaceae bacterium]
MNISKVHIENFKIFKGSFDLTLNKGVNILVGNNEAGKSTIIEAIHLALTGLYNGRYLKNELNQYIFNNQVVEEYIRSLEVTNETKQLPQILIELYFDGENLAEFEGDGNSQKIKSTGITLKIAFDEKYQSEYEELVKIKGVKTLPIEYYNVLWSSFARDENITTKSIPIKSALIDSASNKQNGSDVYISRIVKDFLESEEIVKISQAHRQMKDTFMEHEAILAINKKIKNASKISNKKVELSVELSSKNAWENSLITCVEEIPFHNIGKGEQCIIKTKLALGHKKAKEANIILFEEPENHLSHTKLNQLIKDITRDNSDKQILISTHNSFVANKLGLENLILLNDKKTVRLNDLSYDTFQFFKKLSGYDTLRLILCEKAILVEGDSDELIVQKAYQVKNKKLPIEDSIDIISVRTSFLRFLEIANKIKKQVAVVTDNDGKYDNKIKKKYELYKDSVIIKIFADDRNNLNTLEPQIVDANRENLTALCEILEIDNNEYDTADKISEYMQNNKTDSALKIFNTDKQINFPNYINNIIDWCNEQ